MTRADFAAQYKIENSEFPWLDRLSASCKELYGTDEGLTLKEYLTAWGRVVDEASKRLGKKEK